MKFRTLSFVAAAIVLACGADGRTSPPERATNTPSDVRAQRGGEGRYSVTNLGTLGGASSGGSSINNAGTVAGFSFLRGNTVQRATLWRGGAPLNLGALGGANANSAVEWPVKNDSGVVAGISETDTPDPLREQGFSCKFFIATNGHTCLGFAWENNIMTKLPPIGGNNSYATGMNNHRQVVGWAENATHERTCVRPQILQFEAVIWDLATGRIRELPPLPGDLDGAATAINDIGEVAGISGICDQAVGRYTARHAVVWVDGRAINIGNVGGRAWNTPTAINRRGDVVGFANFAGGDPGKPNPVAFLWTKRDGIRKLLPLAGDTNSEALGINAAGQVVGLSYNAATSTSHAFLWQRGSMVNLDAFTQPGSPHLLYANDINDRGDITGGACVVQGTSCPGQPFAFKAVPAHS